MRVPFVHRLPCPKRCKPFDEKGTFETESTLHWMAGDSGVGTSRCVICETHYAFKFNPDIPLENQPISFVTAPSVQTLNGLVSKVPKKKGKRNADPSNDNR